MVSWHLCPSSGKLSESAHNVRHKLTLWDLSLIGAASRRLTLVKVFLIVLILHLLASIATGIYAIRITFVEGAQYKVDCVSDSVDPAIIQGCDHALVLLKAFVIGVYILGWLLQTCKLICIDAIVNNLASFQGQASLSSNTCGNFKTRRRQGRRSRPLRHGEHSTSLRHYFAVNLVRVG